MAIDGHSFPFLDYVGKRKKNYFPSTWMNPDLEETNFRIKKNSFPQHY